MGRWTIKPGRQNGRLLHWPKCSCVSTKTKLWKLLLRPVRRLYAKFDCPLARQNFSLLHTAPDCETGLLNKAWNHLTDYGILLLLNQTRWMVGLFELGPVCWPELFMVKAKYCNIKHVPARCSAVWQSRGTGSLLIIARHVSGKSRELSFIAERLFYLYFVCLFVCLFFTPRKRDFRNEWCKARALSLVSCLLFLLIIITSDGLSFHITMRSLAMDRYETCRQPVKNCVITISEYVLCPFSIFILVPRAFSLPRPPG